MSAVSLIKEIKALYEEISLLEARNPRLSQREQDRMVQLISLSNLKAEFFFSNYRNKINILTSVILPDLDKQAAFRAYVILVLTGLIR